MTLFLTSSPCSNDLPAGVFLPCILNRANGFVDRLAARWKPDSRVLLIAASPFDERLNDEMRDTFERAFAYHGLTCSNFTLLDARNEGRAPQLVALSDAVILGGGHVPTQNAFFAQIGLRALLRQYPGIVIGISAGSMNCADDVYAQPEEPGEAIDPAFERRIRGLGLTDVMILPHYQMVRDKRIDGLHLFDNISIPDSAGRTFYALVDGSYVVQEDGRALLCGEAWRIRDGHMEKCCEFGRTMEIA